MNSRDDTRDPTPPSDRPQLERIGVDVRTEATARPPDHHRNTAPAMNRLVHLAASCVAAGACLVQIACAEPQGAGTGVAVRGDDGVPAGRRATIAYGGGQAGAGSRSGFAPASGSESLHARRHDRTADVPAGAGAQASASGANGSGERNGSDKRPADGGATAERGLAGEATFIGVNLNGSTTWTRGSGFSRSMSCTDSAGNGVDCGPR